MRSQPAPQVRAASSTSGPICISVVLKNGADAAPRGTRTPRARPTTLPYSTERSGVARNSHSKARLISTPGTAQGAQAKVSTRRSTGDR